jgi:hypothetical protein
LRDSADGRIRLSQWALIIGVALVSLCLVAWAFVATEPTASGFRCRPGLCMSDIGYNPPQGWYQVGGDLNDPDTGLWRPIPPGGVPPGGKTLPAGPNAPRATVPPPTTVGR